MSLWAHHLIHRLDDTAHFKVSAPHGNVQFPFTIKTKTKWSKNVKKSIKRGTGGVAPIRKRAAVQSPGAKDSDPKRQRSEPTSSHAAQNDNQQSKATTVNPFSTTIAYNPQLHEKTAIRVQLPQPTERMQFISTVASFIAKDGASLESRLLELETNNPSFVFLSVTPEDQKAAVLYQETAGQTELERLQKGKEEQTSDSGLVYWTPETKLFQNHKEGG